MDIIPQSNETHVSSINATQRAWGNTTKTILLTDPKILVNISYITISSLIIPSNLFFVFLVACSKPLRKKEYIIPAGLSAADTVFGLFYFIAGVRRIMMLTSGVASEPASAIDCLKEVHNVLFFIGGQSMTLMLNAIAIDRIIAMFNVSYYMKLGNGYAFRMIGCAFAYALLSTLVGVISGLVQGDAMTHTKLCLATWGVAKWYKLYSTLHMVIFGFSSAFLVCLRRPGSVPRQEQDRT